jgi:hypothetical protein
LHAIIQDDGYSWTFGVCAIFFGNLMFGVFFLVPETAYRRDGVFTLPVETKIIDSESKEMSEEPNIQHIHMVLAHEHDASRAADVKDAHLSYTRSHASAEPKLSYIKSLRVYTGRYTYAPLWKILTYPLVLFFYPAVLWDFLI